MNYRKNDQNVSRQRALFSGLAAVVMTFSFTGHAAAIERSGTAKMKPVPAGARVSGQSDDLPLSVHDTASAEGEFCLISDGATRPHCPGKKPVDGKNKQSSGR